MELWAVRKLLLLGVLLLRTTQGQRDEPNSEEERRALMLKHLQEILELSEGTEEEVVQEVTLTEIGGSDGKQILKEEEKEAPLTTTLAPSTTPPAQEEEEDGFTYVFSRLNSLDAAVHRLNVQFYHMDVRVAQFSQGLAEVRGGLTEVRESLASLNEIATRNQKELGRIDGFLHSFDVEIPPPDHPHLEIFGPFQAKLLRVLAEEWRKHTLRRERCLRGRRTQTKCFLIFKDFEVYDGAQKLCVFRGGNLAMPADATELAVLRRYLHDVFQPYNWPAWVGIHDRRAEGMWLFESGQRVSIFDWYRDHLVTQPNGGTRENCVSLSSDDGKWWDNDCERRMYYICEYRL